MHLFCLFYVSNFFVREASTNSATWFLPTWSTTNAWNPLPNQLIIFGTQKTKGSQDIPMTFLKTYFIV